MNTQAPHTQAPNWSWSDREFCAGIHIVPFTAEDAAIETQQREARNAWLLARWKEDRAKGIKTARMLLGSAAFSLCAWAILWIWAAL